MASCDWSFPFFGDRDLSGVHRLINSRAFPLLYSNPVQIPLGSHPCPWMLEVEGVPAHGHGWALRSLPIHPTLGFWDYPELWMSQGKGQGRLSHFLQELSLILQRIHSSFPSSTKILRARQREKKIYQHFHGRNWVFGSFCTSGMGRFYCLVGCLCTGSIPRTQIHRFGAPSAFLGAQSLRREREEQQTGEHFEG